MLRNVLIMASSGIVLFSKEYVNGVAQVSDSFSGSARGSGLSRWLPCVRWVLVTRFFFFRICLSMGCIVRVCPLLHVCL